MGEEKREERRKTNLDDTRGAWFMGIEIVSRMFAGLDGFSASSIKIQRRRW
jgi:hypothetical protein